MWLREINERNVFPVLSGTSCSHYVYRAILIFLSQFIPRRVTGNQGLFAFFSLNSETNFANISWQFDISSLQEARDHPV